MLSYEIYRFIVTLYSHKYSERNVAVLIDEILAVVNNAIHWGASLCLSSLHAHLSITSFRFYSSIARNFWLKPDGVEVNQNLYLVYAPVSSLLYNLCKRGCGLCRKLLFLRARDCSRRTVEFATWSIVEERIRFTHRWYHNTGHDSI